MEKFRLRFAKRQLLQFGIITLLSGVIIPTMAFEKENSPMNAKELDPRGKQLRAEIDHVFKELKEARRLHAGPGTDVTNTVIKYIPVGISFDEAEFILRSAGLQVDPRPIKQPIDNDPVKFDPYKHRVSASTILEKKLLSNYSLWISLSPQKPFDYSVVKKVSAAIFVNTL